MSGSTHVRVDTVTAVLLRDFAKDAFECYGRGNGPCWWDGEYPTLGEAVAELLRRTLAHRNRAYRARRAAQARRLAEWQDEQGRLAIGLHPLAADPVNRGVVSRAVKDMADQIGAEVSETRTVN